jgi:hypothetical protein
MASDFMKALALFAGAFGGYQKGKAQQKEKERQQKIEEDWTLLQSKNLKAETERRQAETGKLREERFQGWIPVTDEFFGVTGVQPSKYKVPPQFGVESPTQYSVPADLFKELMATKNKPWQAKTEEQQLKFEEEKAKIGAKYPSAPPTTRQPTQYEIWKGQQPKGADTSLVAYKKAMTEATRRTEVRVNWKDLIDGEASTGETFGATSAKELEDNLRGMGYSEEVIKKTVENSGLK